MESRNGFVFTERDRVLSSWLKSTELVRDYQNYAKDLGEESKLAKIFWDYAEEEARHAAEFLELLRSYEQE